MSCRTKNFISLRSFVYTIISTSFASKRFHKSHWSFQAFFIINRFMTYSLPSYSERHNDILNRVRLRRYCCDGKSKITIRLKIPTKMRPREIYFDENYFNYKSLHPILLLYIIFIRNLRITYKFLIHFCLPFLYMVPSIFEHPIMYVNLYMLNASRNLIVVRTMRVRCQ